MQCGRAVKILQLFNRSACRLSITDRQPTYVGYNRTVPYKTKSLHGTKPNSNPKTNPNPNTNSIQLFYAFFEHRPMIFKVQTSVKVSCSHVSLTHRLKILDSLVPKLGDGGHVHQ